MKSINVFIIYFCLLMINTMCLSLNTADTISVSDLSNSKSGGFSISNATKSTTDSKATLPPDTSPNPISAPEYKPIKDSSNEETVPTEKDITISNPTPVKEKATPTSSDMPTSTTTNSTIVMAPTTSIERMKASSGTSFSITPPGTTTNLINTQSEPIQPSNKSAAESSQENSTSDDSDSDDSTDEDTTSDGSDSDDSTDKDTTSDDSNSDSSQTKSTNTPDQKALDDSSNSAFKSNDKVEPTKPSEATSIESKPATSTDSVTTKTSSNTVDSLSKPTDTVIEKEIPKEPKAEESIKKSDEVKEVDAKPTRSTDAVTKKEDSANSKIEGIPTENTKKSHQILTSIYIQNNFTQDAVLKQIEVSAGKGASSIVKRNLKIKIPAAKSIYSKGSVTAFDITADKNIQSFNGIKSITIGKDKIIFKNVRTGFSLTHPISITQKDGKWVVD